MWGLIERVTVGEFDFLHAELLIPGLVTSILILICSTVIIIFSLFIVRGKKAQIHAEKLWIIMGLLELCATIIYIIVIDLIFYRYTQKIDYPEHNFWNVYNSHFGMIFPFIGAALSILGAIIGKINKREIN